MTLPAIIKVHVPETHNDFLDRYRKLPPLFTCTIASTETALIPGISAAGASPELIPYTAAADVEALVYGQALCLEKIPENPVGPPSPVIITIAALRELNAPFFIVDAGNAITPKVPMFTAGRKPGRAITEAEAVADVAELFLQGVIIGQQLATSKHSLILGECVPGGTTTAMAVMEALGIAALGKISGSMPGNNQNLKQELVCRNMRKKDLERGSALNDPLTAVRLLGDPMQVVQAGAAMSASRKIPVMLAGGTQMIAVATLIGALLDQPTALQAITLRGSKELINNALEAQLKNIAIATTAWVSEDKSADLRSLIQQLPRPLPLYSVGLDFSTSHHKNLQLYEEGYVKEGVGAGALALSAMLYHDLDNLKFLPMIEKVFEEIYLD